MKHYSTKFIKKYIDEHKRKILSVYCGMREDWSWTAAKVFENGELSCDYDWGSENISVAGITGSTWATPVMEVEFNDGRTEIVECWIDDGEVASDNQIRRQKRFALGTGGMDYKL